MTRASESAQSRRYRGRGPVDGLAKGRAVRRPSTRWSGSLPPSFTSTAIPEADGHASRALTIARATGQGRGPRCPGPDPRPGSGRPRLAGRRHRAPGRRYRGFAICSGNTKALVGNLFNRSVVAEQSARWTSPRTPQRRASSSLASSTKASSPPGLWCGWPVFCSKLGKESEPSNCFSAVSGGEELTFDPRRLEGVRPRPAHASLARAGSPQRGRAPPAFAEVTAAAVRLPSPPLGQIALSPRRLMHAVHLPRHQRAPPRPQPPRMSEPRSRPYCLARSRAACPPKWKPDRGTANFSVPLPALDNCGAPRYRDQEQKASRGTRTHVHRRTEPGRDQRVPASGADPMRIQSDASSLTARPKLRSLRSCS